MEDVLLIYYEQIVSFYTQIQTNSKDIFSDRLPLFVVCPWPHDHLHDYWSVVTRLVMTMGQERRMNYFRALWRCIVTHSPTHWQN